MQLRLALLNFLHGSHVKVVPAQINEKDLLLRRQSRDQTLKPAPVYPPKTYVDHVSLGDFVIGLFVPLHDLRCRVLLPAPLLIERLVLEGVVFIFLHVGVEIQFLHDLLDLIAAVMPIRGRVQQLSVLLSRPRNIMGVDFDEVIRLRVCAFGPEQRLIFGIDYADFGTQTLLKTLGIAVSLFAASS